MTPKPEQQRVYDWLANKLGLPVFADVYLGAVFLLSQKPNGYISFIAHAGRDIMNGLAPTIKGVKREQVQYSQLVGNLVGLWQPEWGAADGLTEKTEISGHIVPIEVCKKISILIDNHIAGSNRKENSDILFFTTFLDSDKDKIPNNFISEWVSAKKWFMEHTHLRAKAHSDEAEKEVAKHFSCLDGYLYIAASSQYERLKSLDEILDETNK